MSKQRRDWQWWRKTVYNIFMRSEMGTHAAQIAYYIILVIVPTLLIIANIIPYLPFSYQTIRDYVFTVIPSNLHRYVDSFINGYLLTPNNSALSFGIIVALWSTSKAFTSLQLVFNKIYRVDNRKNFFVVQLFSFIFSVAATILLMATIVIFAFGNQILIWCQEWFGWDDSILGLFNQMKWIVAPSVLFVLLTFIYAIVPNVRRSIVYAIPGAITATIGMLMVSQLYRVYGLIVGRQALTNGTIGVVMVLIIWLYILSNVLIFGAVINVIVYTATHPEVAVSDS